MKDSLDFKKKLMLLYFIFIFNVCNSNNIDYNVSLVREKYKSVSFKISNVIDFPQSHELVVAYE